MHDILDYTLLDRDETTLNKNISPFDIKDSINEIIDIQRDKATMKNINVRTMFKGFDNDMFIVKTD